MLKIRQHDYKSSASYLKLIPEEEMPLDKVLPEIYQISVRRNAKKKFLSYRAGLSTSDAIVDEYSSLTYEESQVYVNELRKELVSLNLPKQTRCAIYAKNSPLWMLADYAITFCDYVTVTIFDTLGIDNIQYCLKLVEAEVIFTTNEYLPNIAGMLDLLPDLKHILLFDREISNTNDLAMKAAEVVAHFGPGNYSIIDETKSMYSFGGTVNEAIEREDNQRELEELAKPAYEFFTNLASESNGRTVRIHICKRPETINEETIKQANKELVIPEGQTYDSLNSVVFSSGTSGKPKGAILTHKNVASGGACLCRQFVPYSVADDGKQSSTLSYLPLAHVFERCYEHILAYRGYNIYYSSGSMRNIVKDIELSKVSCFIAVPRVYQKIYDNFQLQLQKQSFVVRGIFNVCYELKKLYLDLRPAAYRTGKMPVVDKIAFSKIAQLLGGRMEFMISGSSALPKRVYDFLRICSCARVTIGFGLTETSVSGLFCYCGMHLYSPNELGYAAAFVDAGIAPVEGMEAEFANEKVGELCIKSPGLVQGYVDGQWGRVRQITDENGYFRTGDLVKLNPDESCTFIRRIKNIVKLQQGEFVDLEAVESALESSPLITAAFVHGDASRPAPVAIVCVDSKACLAKFGTLGDIDNEISKLGNQLVRGSGLKGFNVPGAYLILKDIDWTTDRELYTPSSKKIYNGFRRVFAKELAELLSESEKKASNVQKAKGDGLKWSTVAGGILIAIGALVIALK